ncbi:ATP synthase-associated magnesium import membrane protein AtpI [Syntrophotalea carbinolica DSM 2380]|uniref:ATP synthase-associated magnesium import membrane protein AtpI n=1 Tax=Syntrophotalea carbinolica (strain DSM 2380 / NBRC 103641 / GraBd1) TaxID=338963 RepID=Q3A8L5_SYNC1|nr:ATP synthase subunit I [Syntrophotalea carbinolica]ABA87277.1 ATP synthase-associated magnesium import membrane protein AtpI [Syntrophotalea carbinolica DSM 2380]
MTTGSDTIIRDLSRRNWLILGAMVLGSLLWQSRAVTVGVLGGGLTVIGGFQTLHRSLSRLLSVPGQRSGLGFQCGSFIRLACLAGAIFVLIGPLKAHPLALSIGLSVVVANLLWTTLLLGLA